jgi:hypothetical protein
LPVTSAVTEVTVYRGQALVTRTVPLPEGAGELELLVGDLPELVVGTSVAASAEGVAGVAIRSVRFQTRAAAEAPQKAIAQLDEQLKDLARKTYALTQQEALLASARVHLDKLENFAAPTASVEMSKGVLNPETLSKVSQYILQQRAEQTAEQIKLHDALEDLHEQAALLQRKRNELTGGSKTAREATIFVSKTERGPSLVKLTYLVDGADWSPTYNLRLSEDGKTVHVEYLAQVQQTSGEDWSNVKLTLSTATPAMNAEDPLLAPLWLGLTAGTGQSGGIASFSGYNKAQVDNSTLQMGALGAWNTYSGQTNISGGNATFNAQNQDFRQQKPVAANWELNRLAAVGQALEINGGVLVVRGGAGAAKAVAAGLAVSYDLPGKMSLVSRADQQLVQIAALKLAAGAYYVATPVLSQYVYRRANLVNTDPTPLLAGPYSAYIGGEFVGRGQLPLVASGQEVTVGFGVDTQLRCGRELKDKSDTTSWGSRVQTFAYELRLENYKKTPVRVRLMDRVPASKSEDLQVKVLKPGEALSTDAVYVRDLKDSGILRWDIDLAGSAYGEQVRRIEYAFEMKYAKDAHVGREAAPMADVMREDLDRIMLKEGR